MARVSIITPMYNPTEEQYETSRKSLMSQTSKDFEWVTVDDGSDENPFYREITLGNNYGPSVARNVGFQVATGDIIAYLDLGDVLYDDRVEILIATFDSYKDTSLLFSAYIIREINNEFVFNPFDYIGITMSSLSYIELLEKQNISIPLGTAHRRKPFVEVGGFQRGIVCGEDGVLWRRMVNHLGSNKCMFSDAIAGIYNVNPKGQSRTQKRFKMGGFAIDGSLKDNGGYLDSQWYKEYSSDGYYE